MKKTEIPIDCDKYFLNGDFISQENYVLINDRKQIFRNGELLEIKGNYTFVFPKVRIISDNQFLLVDSEKPYEANNKDPNAWVINNNGKIEYALFLGSVNQMILTKKHIIASYSDSQLDTHWKYGQNGLVVFDFEGNSLFEYYRDEGKSKCLNFIENYAFLEKDKDTIYYMPYEKFPIVEFSLIDFSSKVLFNLPDEKSIEMNHFWNPKAFSKKGENWYFITPDIENNFSRIFKMNLKMEIEEIGTCCFSHFPKGLKEGCFFVPFSGGKGLQRKCQYIEV